MDRTISFLVSVLVGVDELDPEDHDDEDHERESYLQLGPNAANYNGTHNRW